MRTWAGRAARAFGPRARLLLVLAVLTGLVAMHGLGPAPLAPAAHAPAHGALGASGASGHDAPAADPCARVHADPQGGSGGHTEHADATCAAPGTSGPPVLSEPAKAPGTVTAAPAGPYGVLTGATACGRAPPSLSELQLLRV